MIGMEPIKTLTMTFDNATRGVSDSSSPHMMDMRGNSFCSYAECRGVERIKGKTHTRILCHTERLARKVSRSKARVRSSSSRNVEFYEPTPSLRRR